MRNRTMNTNQTKIKAPKLKATETKKVKSMSTKSGAIRYLHAQGYKNADIARVVGCRDQMVSNILRATVKNPVDK
jgi:antitoxin component HigA of HigAB toxin-antitoxin module